MKGWVALGLGAVVFAGAGAWLAQPPPPPPAPPPSQVSFGPSYLAPRGVPELAPGQEITVVGGLRAGYDGAFFDGATRTLNLPSGPSVSPGGLFEIERAGLRVSSRDPGSHLVRLAATGADAPACAAAGVSAPCLVPRTKELAFERLQTESEFRATLAGQISATLPSVAPLPPPRGTNPLAYACFAASGGLAIGAVLLGLKRRRETLIARVRAAAQRARAATSKDPSFAEIARKIDDLVGRAEDLEASREACEARLAKLDRRALVEKRERLLASSDKTAADTLAWVSREIAEADKVAADASAALQGLERVLSALGVIELEAREHRGVKVRVEGDDPVDAVAEELALREAALDEADRAVPKAAPPPPER
ncbi:MAG: hypothetical protein JNL38_10265 [Myxococcales bacterium]|jgi:hypothetical protein|nr:hypothetical protein [Myxococcales bacterium]